MKEKIIFAFAVSMLIFPTVMAAVSCPSCIIGGCSCSISDCAIGTIDIYSSSTCQGNPLFEYSFTGGSFPWFPSDSGTYYMQVLCDDGRTKSICSQVPVMSTSITTGSTSEIQTTPQSSTPTQTSGGSSNIIFYVLIIIIIVVIAFIVYRLFSKKKAKKINYESLYRKWGR